MRRKLIKQGLGGVTLSLPIKWVRNNNLQGGDEVSLETDENKLILSNTEPIGKKRKEIILETTNKNHLRSVVSSAYKAGYTEIVLKSKQNFSLKLLNEIVNSFTGLELVDQSEKSVTIKSFIVTEEQEIERLIIKMFQITKTIASSFLERNSNLNYIESLALTNMRKLRDHCLRSININRYGGDKTYDYYDLVTILEKISAEFYILNKELIVKGSKLANNCENFVNLFDNIYQSFLKKNFVYSNSVWLAIGKEKEILKNLKPSLINMYNYRIAQLLRHLSSRILGLSS
jgi:hypothetical protein